MDLHCVTRWSKMDTLWEGVTLKTLINEGILKPMPMARFLMQHAAPQYTVNLPIEVALGDNFLLATLYNGQPIPVDHGYPVRAVIGAIPGRSDLNVPYLWKGAKWLTGLEFLARDHRGYWEQAGYHNEADVWKEQRFAD
jgi:DMSO/TMAO reductase YedYZ molybdopterin-dependent catalytic subunit